MCVQEFEKKEHKLKARAATNLAFLYSLEGDSANAERYADLAVGTDKYSAQALVNKASQDLQPTAVVVTCIVRCTYGAAVSSRTKSGLSSGPFKPFLAFLLPAAA